MPVGDVTYEKSIRAREAELVNGARPYNTVEASLPANLETIPAAPHVDKMEYPALPPSPNIGVGGIKGTKDQPKATNNGVPAFRHPLDGKGPP